jgi:hypothetical protein
MFKRRTALLAQGMACLVLLVSSQAFGQTADLSVALTPPLDAKKNPVPGSFGGSGKYTVTIANSETGSVAHGVKFSVANPQIADPPVEGARATYSIVSGCASLKGNAEGQVFPCEVPDIVDAESAEVVFTINLQVPDPLPATCPDTATYLGTSTVTVTSTTTDPVADNNTASFTHTVKPYADLEATLEGPATANVGDLVDFTVTVKNLGPCDSAHVVVDTFQGGGPEDGSPLVGAGLRLQSSGTPCADVTDAMECGLDTLRSGQSITFKKTYKVEELPSSLISTGDPNGIEVTSNSTDPQNDNSTDDPNGDNNSATTNTLVTTSSGCSASGLASPALPLALAALLGFRRRFPRAKA